MKIWKERAPLAYARLTHARFHLAERAGILRMPVENLISPELVRRVMWASEKEPDRLTDVTKMLREGGAREWQIRESVESIKMALRESEPLVVEESDSPSQE